MVHSSFSSCGNTISLRNEPVESLNDSVDCKYNFEVKNTEKTGDLFVLLGKSRSQTKTVRLVDYNATRFLSITNAICRFLEK